MQKTFFVAPPRSGSTSSSTTTTGAGTGGGDNNNGASPAPSASVWRWLDEPSDWGVEEPQASGSSPPTLRIAADAQRDYWSRTFYSPLLIKADAPAVVTRVAAAHEATLSATMRLAPISQFDQGGLFVLCGGGGGEEDSASSRSCWVKAGVEFVDGEAMLSCVVTNGGFSDWSTQPLRAFLARGASGSGSGSGDQKAPDSEYVLELRVHKLCPGAEQGSSLVFEARASSEEEFTMVRIARLGDVGDDWQMGAFAACPVAQKGCEVIFEGLQVGPPTGTRHDAALDQ